MTPNEDELLSGYLDGELSGGEREWVESALKSDPSAGDRLQELAQLRRAVSELSRAAMPTDLSAPVMARVRVLESRRRRISRAAAGIGLALGFAASLLIAFLYTSSPRRFENAPGFARDHRDSQPTAGGPDHPALDSDWRFASKLEPAPGNVVAANAPAEQPPAVAPEVSYLSKRSFERSQAIARKMLERPDVRRITVVVDSFDAPEAKLVDRAIRAVGRKSARFAQMQLVQGVVIDPARPRAAVVYAVVMDAIEEQNFRRRLSESLPNRVLDEPTLDPAIVTQLADVGQIDVYDGNPAGTLKPSPDAMLAGVQPNTARPAARVESLPINPRDRGIDLVSPADGPSSDRKSYASIPLGAVGSSSRVNPDGHPISLVGVDGPRSSTDDATSVILVWVTDRRPVESTPRR